MKQTAIELKKYSFRYANEDKWVLSEVDFTLKYGELIVLSGLSGEGKSTLLSSMNGIIPKIIPGEQKGDIFVDGLDVKQMSPSEIALKVGSVLQNADSQIVYSRVEDEIAFGCENISMDAGEIEKQVQYTCNVLELDRNWFSKTLSGGQKQRLITASILAMKQKILLFDEPLANLDLEGARVLLQILKGLTAKGYAILLIEHRLDVVLPYADKIAWLEEGRLQIGSGSGEASGRTAVIPGCADSTAGMSEPCFILEDVSYCAGDRDILKKLNFSINKGERVVVLGENGCGKTTLMRLLARIIQPSEGCIRQSIDRSRKKKPSSDWFKKVGFVYQNPGYQLFMPTVIDEISYQSAGESIAEEMLRQFRLDGLRDRHPHSLSEGQKRRLTIACVMAMEPNVILLDEPTVGQDFEGLKNIIRIMNEIHAKTGNTMITITHDFRCAQALADKVIWMKRGQVCKIGGPSIIKEYYEQNFSQGQQ